MRFGSVCSGIEAASVAFGPLGWNAAWLAEIEPFPSALLAYRFPTVSNLGDMTRIAGMVDSGEIEAPDLLCGGTPCQSFSVAGLRKSLDDARGNLSLEFIRIADAIDRVRCAAGKQPAYILWENVPGVLSTSDNAFGAFLGGLCGSDSAIGIPDAGWPTAGVVAGSSRIVAWRVLDAQYFGLAQRRKRVFVLALGGAGGWRCADALLPIGHSLSGHPAPSREAREDIAPTLDVRAGRSGETSFHTSGGLIASAHADVSPALKANSGRNQIDATYLPVAHSLTGEGFDASEDGTGRGTPLVPVAFDEAQITSAANRTRAEPGLPASTLAKGSRMHVAFLCKDNGADAGSLAPTLRAMGHSGSHANAGGQVALAFDAYNQAVGQVTHSLRCGTGNGMGDEIPQAFYGSAVRRLTPMECERLQGFPDGWTDAPYRGKPAADGPRYKAIGNSWAVPVVRWVGQRIEQVEAITSARVAA